MSEETDDLLPCPFCGAGEFRVEESTHWTGMQSVVLSVTVRHWCPRPEGQPMSHIALAGKTREDAIARWNRRVGAA